MAENGTIRPSGRLRRSFIYRILEQAGAHFAEVNGAAVARDFGSAEADLEAARSMGLADLSPLARTGFKGAGALDWARGQGVVIGDANNTACRQPDGALTARLADTEVLVTDSFDGTGALPNRLKSHWSAANPRGIWLVNRQAANFWFMVTGTHSAKTLAKLCAVDLRPAKFPPGAVAQTPVARTNCIVIRDDLGDVPGWHLLGDSASAEYQWGCLADAMAEFAGRPVGLDALRRLAPGSARG